MFTVRVLSLLVCCIIMVVVVIAMSMGAPLRRNSGIIHVIALLAGWTNGRTDGRTDGRMDGKRVFRTIISNVGRYTSYFSLCGQFSASPAQRASPPFSPSLIGLPPPFLSSSSPSRGPSRTPGGMLKSSFPLPSSA